LESSSREQQLGDLKVFQIVFFFIFFSFLKKSIAGYSTEGSQFDARQYDAKMDSVYVKKLSFLSLTSSSLCVLPYHMLLLNVCEHL
jgi:hypothetical protein